MVTRHYVLRVTRQNKDAIDGFIANYRYGLTLFVGQNQIEKMYDYQEMRARITLVGLLSK